MNEAFNQYLQTVRESRQIDSQKYAMEKVKKRELAQNIFQSLNAIKDIGLKISQDSKLRNQYQTVAKEAGVFDPKQWGGATEREENITTELQGMTKQQMDIIDRMSSLENKIPKNGPRNDKEARDIDYTRKKLDVLKRVLAEKDNEIMEKNNFLTQYRQSPQYQVEYENDAFKKFYRQSPLYSPKYFEANRQTKQDPMKVYERKKRIDAQYKSMDGNAGKAFTQIKYLKDEYDNISKDFNIDDETKQSKQIQLIDQMENILQEPGLSQVDVKTGKAILPQRPKKIEDSKLVLDPKIYEGIEAIDLERLRSSARGKWGVSAKDIDKAMNGEEVSDEKKLKTIKEMIAVYMQKKLEKKQFLEQFNK